MTQVAASALATVAGAVLASELGVAGTVTGAAVVSIAATTSGAVLQHFFRRTGEQLREAADTGPGGTVNSLRQVPAAAPGPAPAISPDWNRSRVQKAGRRWTWKSYAAVSALVFVLAMVPILAFELVTGQPVSATVQGGTGRGTSFGGTVHDSAPATPGGSSPGSSAGPSAGSSSGAPAPASGGQSPSSSPSALPSPSATPGTSGTGPARPTATPSAEPSGQSPGEPSAGPAPGGQASSAPAAPAPSAAPSEPAAPAQTP
ncbi:hypothetical protein [Kitasatospora sp. NPDC057223]|uniref:hypothetical protein n=1 Tax=Kitasatospora sp. NPDC057223 TaxID=3346055 RepID=UPI00362CCEE9